MDSYARYRQARDAAWRALLKVKEASLPLDPEALASRLGLEILDLAEARRQPHLAGLLDHPGVCASLRIDGKWRLFLAPGLDGPRRRFAVAHELGHLLTDGPLHFPVPGVAAFVTAPATGDLMPDASPESADYTADIFALRLLAPACVLHELRADTPGAIAALCGLPPRAAAFRAERMALLNQRDAFYVNALERRVRDRFRPFMRQRLCPATPSSGRAIPAAVPRTAENRPGQVRRRHIGAALLFGIAAAGIAAWLLLR